MQETLRCIPPEGMTIEQAFELFENLPILNAVYKQSRSGVIDVLCEDQRTATRVHNTLVSHRFRIREGLMVRFGRWLLDQPL